MSTAPLMTEEWSLKLAEEQCYTHVTLDGKLYPRVRYGGEYPGTTLPATCRDCGCDTGEIHVRGCCVEHCAKCSGQALTCECFVPGD